jgi:hypothetical protein
VSWHMNWHDVALALAGIIGSSVALIHGVLVQRLVVGPMDELAQPRLAPTIRRLLVGLMQFSTYNWFIGGVALVVAAWAFGPEARLAAAVLVGSSYLFGAVGNLWATRGRHPGWVLYAIALGLIVYGVGG